MRVLILTNELLKGELLPADTSLQLELEIIDIPVASSTTYDACIDLLFDNTETRIDWLKSLQPALVVVNSVIIPLQHLPAEFIRINGWPTFLRRNVIEAAGISELAKERATTLFRHFGRQIEWVPDISGFISARVISSIINEAFYTLEEQVSTVEEIDIAMKLGTNYPDGPFSWGQEIGLYNVYSLLSELGLKQKRYKPAPLLKQKALA